MKKLASVSMKPSMIISILQEEGFRIDASNPDTFAGEERISKVIDKEDANNIIFLTIYEDSTEILCGNGTGEKLLSNEMLSLVEIGNEYIPSDQEIMSRIVFDNLSNAGISNEQLLDTLKNQAISTTERKGTQTNTFIMVKKKKGEAEDKIKPEQPKIDEQWDDLTK